MAALDGYPTGTPTGTDHVPYIEDPAGTPTLRLAAASTLLGGGGGGGGLANPWGLFAATATLDEEFDGTSGLTWGAVAPASGGGHATWAVGNDVASVAFGGQADSTPSLYLTASVPAVGESVEVAFAQGGALIAGFAGLAVTDGTADSANLFVAGDYFNGTGHLALARGAGTIAAIAGSSVFLGLMVPAGRPLRHRLTRTTTSTWTYAISLDGVSWTSLGTSAITWAHTPSHVGLVVSAWAADTATYGDLLAAFDYLRVS